MKYLSILLLFLPYTISAGIMSQDVFIRHVEKKYRLPKGIIKAIIKVESRGRAAAINHNDGTTEQKAYGLKIKSYGLMQIQLSAARSVGFRGKPSELLIPTNNIEYGAKYFSVWYHKYHDVARALTCFNSGPSSYSCRIGKHTPYVGLILNALF